MNRSLLVLAGLALVVLLVPAAAAKGVTVTAKQSPDCGGKTFCFDPDSFAANAGEEVVVTLVNPSGGAAHSFCVALPAGEQCTPNALQGTNPGSNDTLRFLAPSAAGTHKYLCKVPGHEALGMIGNFTVLGSAGPAPPPSPPPPGQRAPMVGLASIVAGVALLALALRRR